MSPGTRRACQSAFAQEAHHSNEDRLTPPVGCLAPGWPRLDMRVEDHPATRDSVASAPRCNRPGVRDTDSFNASVPQLDPTPGMLRGRFVDATGSVSVTHP